jgi:multisubunit Na+/H+ antiporter MnhF subunit
MRFIDEGGPMSTRARVVSITAMWTSVLLSMALLRASGRLSTALAVTVVLVAAIGTVAVLRFRRAPRPAAAATESCSS